MKYPVDIPVIPPPMTTTSTSKSSSGGGKRRTSGSVDFQIDWFIMPCRFSGFGEFEEQSINQHLNKADVETYPKPFSPKGSFPWTKNPPATAADNPASKKRRRGRCAPSSILILRPLDALLFFQEPSQHVLQNASVSEILDFDVAVESRDGVEGHFIAVGFSGRHAHALVGFETIGHSGDVENLVTAQAQVGGRSSVGVHQGQHTHADQVASVNAFVAFGEHRPHAQEVRSLGRPVPRAPAAVFL